METTNIIGRPATARSDFAMNNGQFADAGSQSFAQVLSNAASPKGIASDTPVAKPKSTEQTNPPLSPQATDRKASTALSRGQQPAIQELSKSGTSTASAPLPVPALLTTQESASTGGSHTELIPSPTSPSTQADGDAPGALVSATPSTFQGQTPASTGAALPVVVPSTEELASSATYLLNNVGAAQPASDGPEPVDSPLTANFLDSSPQAGVATVSPLSAKIAANLTQVLHAQQPDAAAQPMANAPASSADGPSLPQSDSSASAAGSGATTASETAQHMSFIATTFRTAASLVSSTTQMMFSANEFGPAKMPTAQPPVATPGVAAPQASSNTQNSAGGGTGSDPNEHSTSEPTPTAPTANDSTVGTFTTHPSDSGMPTQALNPVAMAASPVGPQTTESSRTDNSRNASMDSSSGGLSQASAQTDDSSPNSLLPVSSGALASGQVSQARLIDSSRGEEMRVTLDTDTLGPIELRAISDKDRIGAVITAVKPETQEFLNTDLPSLHQALSDRNLQVQQISVSQGSLAGGMSGRGAFSQTGNPWHEQAPLNHWQTTEEGISSGENSPSAMTTVAVPGRLSVHV